MTYTALITLAILRDDFSRLDRRGLVALLRATQKEDGRYGVLIYLLDLLPFCPLD